jgi:hypothetical protein
MDTNISICSPEVLMMFSDNFDYQTLKRDFVVGTLSEEELGKKIYLHMLQVRGERGGGWRGGGHVRCPCCVCGCDQPAHACAFGTFGLSQVGFDQFGGAGPCKRLCVCQCERWPVYNGVT